MGMMIHRRKLRVEKAKSTPNTPVEPVVEVVEDKASTETKTEANRKPRTKK